MEKCLQLLNNRRQSISLRDEAPKTISSPRQHEAYISRLLELRRKAHRAAEETETAKLLIVLIADYEGKHLTTEKASAAQVLKELMNANGLRRKELAPVEQTTDGKTHQRFRVSPAVFF